MIGADALPADLAHAVEITSNLAALGLLESATEALIAAGDTGGALGLAGAAACWCVENHPGVFNSHRLEQALLEINRRTVTSQAVSDPNGPIVHLVTRARPIGGDAGLTWRWIVADRDHEHLVVITDQAGEALPPALTEAAGGKVVMIPNGRATDAVSTIHRLLDGASRVVLNVAEHDTVALAAVADPANRPPTMMLNRADHRFFLGTGFADALLNLRPSALELSARRRGTEGARNLAFPIPVEELDRSRPLKAAKQGLGMDPTASVLLTVTGTRTTYCLPGQPGFGEAVARVMAARPECHLVAVGASRDEPAWAGLCASFAERVHVLEPQPGLRPLLEAADVYLEPFQSSAGTSLLEAAQLGVVPVVFGPAHSELGYDAFGVEPVRGEDADAWVDRVLELLDSPDRRLELGSAMAAGVRAVHGTSGLAERIRRSCAEMPTSRTSIRPSGRARCEVIDRELIELHLDCHPRMPVTAHLTRHLAERGLRVDGLPPVPVPDPQREPFSVVTLLTDEMDLQPVMTRVFELLAWQPSMRVHLIDTTGRVGCHLPEVDPRLTTGWTNAPDCSRLEAWASAARLVTPGPVLFVTGESVPGPRLLSALQIATEWPDAIEFLTREAPTLSVSSPGQIAELARSDVVTWR